MNEMNATLTIYQPDRRAASRAFPVWRDGGAETWALDVQGRGRALRQPPAAATQTGVGHLHPQESGERAPQGVFLIEHQGGGTPSVCMGFHHMRLDSNCLSRDEEGN